MKKLLKIVKWVGIGLVGMTMLITISLLGYKGYLKYSTSVDTPNGISSLEEITLGGVKQWILIRGTDKSNPVLIFLHGGPGAPVPGISSTRTQDAELIKHFTVVHWDQRGTGKSYDPNIDVASMTYDQLTEDCNELIDYVTDRLNKEKVYLVGYSSGSVIGVMTAYRYPDKIVAFVGVGQIINAYEKEKVSYEFVAAEAEEAGDEKVLKALEAIGPPPYDSFEEQNEINGLISKYGGVITGNNASKLGLLVTSFLTSPEYSFSEGLNSFMLEDYEFTMTAMWRDFEEIDLSEKLRSLEIPVYFFEGKYDMANPTVLVEEFQSNLNGADNFQLFVFDNSAHFLLVEEYDKYQELLIKVVLEETLSIQ